MTTVKTTDPLQNRSPQITIHCQGKSTEKRIIYEACGKLSTSWVSGSYKSSPCFDLHGSSLCVKMKMKLFIFSSFFRENYSFRVLSKCFKSLRFDIVKHAEAFSFCKFKNIQMLTDTTYHEYVGVIFVYRTYKSC